MSEYETMSHESSGLCWCGPNNHGPEIKAWDTEYGDYIAWGTHNPAVARLAVRKYILEVVGEHPNDLDDMTPPTEDFRNATRYWADPKVLENDDESPWDSSEYARHEEGYIPYDGWVPYMVIAL
jgi:hypothetical protein